MVNKQPSGVAGDRFGVWPDGVNLQRKEKDSGVALLEVLIAVFVFMIGLGSIIDVEVQSMNSGQKTINTYTAYNIAKNRVERLKAVNFNLLSSSNETATSVDQYGSPDPNGSYSRSTTITTNYQGSTHLTQISVNVTYTWKGVTSAPTTLASVVYG